MTNFQAITDEMSAAGATCLVTDAEQIAGEVARLMDDDNLYQQRIAAADAVASAKQEILNDIVAELTPYLWGPSHATA